MRSNRVRTIFILWGCLNLSQPLLAADPQKPISYTYRDAERADAIGGSVAQEAAKAREKPGR